MADQMRAFLADAQQRSGEELAKSRQAMDDSVSKVLSQLTVAVEQMETVRKNAASQEQSRADKMANRTQELVGGLSGQVEELLKAVQDQVAKTQSNIDAISNVTVRAIDGMNIGAQNMGAAAQRFETAGGAVSGVFDKSARVTDQLATTAGSLQAAAAAVKQGFDQYETTRRTVDSNVAALTTLIENAKKEAGLSRQMLTDLEGIVGQLKTAETQSLHYLEGVNKTLTTAFQNFGTQLAEQVRKAVGETDRQLGGGVQQLTGVVQELGSALSRLKKA
jgi:ABC-type transporter Mla subunit MlaD